MPNTMTAKQRYQERRRLRAERLLEEELSSADRRRQHGVVEAQVLRTMAAVERLADVMELWADMQTGDAND